jgi:hypothetical protein
VMGECVIVTLHVHRLYPKQSVVVQSRSPSENIVNLSFKLGGEHRLEEEELVTGRLRTELNKSRTLFKEKLVVYYESRNREVKMRLMNVPQQNKLEIPSGRAHDPDTMVAPLTHKPTRKALHTFRKKKTK